MFPNHIKLVYHTQALKQVRTQNCIIQEESKKVHSVQYPDIHCYRISSYECITTVEVIVMSNQN